MIWWKYLFISLLGTSLTAEIYAQNHFVSLLKKSVEKIQSKSQRTFPKNRLIPINNKNQGKDQRSDQNNKKESFHFQGYNNIPLLLPLLGVVSIKGSKVHCSEDQPMATISPLSLREDLCPDKIKSNIKLKKIMDNWLRQLKFLPEFSYFENNKKKYNQLLGSKKIINIIIGQLKGEFNRTKTVLICDQTGLLRSIAILDYKPEIIHIKLLVSSPYNFNSFENKGLKGAGTAMIEAIFKREQLNGYQRGIELMPLASSLGFYQKLGFELVDQQKNIYGLSYAQGTKNK